ncbi:MAG: ferredoxin [Dermatophilaceae bacterium]
MSSRRDRRQHVLVVDWQQCQAHGLCAELLPERVLLDPWGYPVVTGPVSEAQLRHAREAVTACPRRALRLDRA